MLLTTFHIFVSVLDMRGFFLLASLRDDAVVWNFRADNNNCFNRHTEQVNQARTGTYRGRKFRKERSLTYLEHIPIQNLVWMMASLCIPGYKIPSLEQELHYIFLIISHRYVVHCLYLKKLHFTARFHKNITCLMSALHKDTFSYDWRLHRHIYILYVSFF